MSKRWSKLQSRLYNLTDPEAGFQIHCVLYKMNSKNPRGSTKLPRYFITIGKDIIFDYPKEFDTTGEYYDWNVYPGLTDVDLISNLIEEYIQRSKKNLWKPFENDKWGLTDILRVCDRRIGKRKLQELKQTTTNEILLKIIERRIAR